MNPGFPAVLAAFLIWGLFPLYFRALALVPPTQILAHRIVWCAALVIGYLSARNGPLWWRGVRMTPRLLAMLAASSALIGGNWLLYVWAVNSAHVVETSLGYFINPLLNVLLGVLVLRERLRTPQWLAVALAAIGVAYLTLRFGHLPWIALSLAGAFALYGLLRKTADIESVPGLGIESGLLFVPALVYLLWAEHAGTGRFLHEDAVRDALLIGCGPATALPLILFAYGARRIPYSMVGVVQYVAPTLQLVCAVLLFHEPFTATHVTGFGFIWAGLTIYAADGVIRLRRNRASDLLQQRP